MLSYIRPGVRAALSIPDQDAAVREHGVRSVLRSGLPEDSRALAFAVRFVRGRANPRTAETYGDALLPWLAHCAVRGLDPFEARPSEADLFFASMYHLAPKTRALRCAAIRTYYELAIDDRLTTENPFRRVVQKKPRRKMGTPSIKEGDFERVLADIRGDFDDPRRARVARRDYALVYLAGRIGTRRIELHRATWGDLTTNATDGKNLRVLGKGDVDDEIGLPADVLAVLLEWGSWVAEQLGRALRGSDAVFPALRQNGIDRFVDGRLVPVGAAQITTIVRNRLKAVGIVGKRFAAHSLRATAATVAYDNGASIEAVQGLLRHSTTAQSQMYVTDYADDRGRAARMWSGPEQGHEPPNAAAT